MSWEILIVNLVFPKIYFFLKQQNIFFFVKIKSLADKTETIFFAQFRNYCIDIVNLKFFIVTQYTKNVIFWCLCKIVICLSKPNSAFFWSESEFFTRGAAEA
jgi:hypothetical protein